MKLSAWARSQGISYLTAYRWFKEKQLPVNAYQTKSGTIIVDDQEPSIKTPNTNDSVSLFLKKTVEFSKNNSTIEDFAAYILSNFSIQANPEIIEPKYTKNKPNSEEIQEHYKQFLVKGEKPKPNMFVADESVLNTVDIIENNLYQSEPTATQLNLTDPSFTNLVGDLSRNIMSSSYLSNSNYSPSFNSNSSGFTFGDNNSYFCSSNDSIKLGQSYAASTINVNDLELIPESPPEKPRRGRPRKNK